MPVACQYMAHVIRRQLAERLLQNSKMQFPFKPTNVANVIYGPPGINTKV